MRIIIFFLLFYLLPFNIICQESKPCTLNVDSMFTAHFKSLNYSILHDTINQYVPPSDRYFVQLISFLSGIETEKESYSFHPWMNRNKLCEYIEWYLNNKNKVKCESVERGIYILKYEITEETIEELEKMRIK